MDKEFWHDRWQSNQIGFHEAQVQPLLAAHWPALRLPAGAQVLVPLCGKSLDMRWLQERGLRVLGVELSELAIAAFYDAEGLDAERSEDRRFVRHSAGNYDLLCGDFFDLTASDVCDVSAVYDRAALVALPGDMRRRYASHLLEILSPGVQILLVTLEFSVPEISSPPFPVSPDEIGQLFGARCAISRLETSPTTVKGHAAMHTALHLRVR